MFRPFTLWLCWLALVFGAMNIYGPSLNDVSRPHDHPAKLSKQVPPSALNFVLILQRESSDVDRYFSYASAVLGRPYAAEYIRPVGETALSASAERVIIKPTALIWPWKDFQVEYPPGIFLPILIPAVFTADSDTYFVLFCVEMEIVLTAAVLLAVKTANIIAPDSTSKALTHSIILTAALGCISVRRYDACVALAISATLNGLATRRPIVTGISLAVGFALKVVPILLAPLVVFWYITRRDWNALRQAVVSGALCGGAIGAAYLAAARGHSLDFLYFHADRPVQIESTLGGILMLLKGLFPRIIEHTKNYGSDNVVSPIEPTLRHFAEILQASILVSIYFLSYHKLKNEPDDRRKLILVNAAAGAGFVSFMCLGKVFSPQYMTWLIPIGVIATASSVRRLGWRQVAANALTQVEYPYLYFLTVSISVSRALTFVFGLLIVARTLVLGRWIAKMVPTSAERVSELQKLETKASMQPP
jgi:hypothetical protein